MKRECDSELAAAIGMTGVMSHAPKRGRDLIGIGSVIFCGKGNVTVGASSGGCTQAGALGNFGHRSTLAPAQIEGYGQDCGAVGKILVWSVSIACTQGF